MDTAVYEKFMIVWNRKSIWLYIYEPSTMSK